MLSINLRATLTYASPLTLEYNTVQNRHRQHSREYDDGPSEHLETARVRQRQTDVHN